jgi:hypothetical protein
MYLDPVKEDIILHETPLPLILIRDTVQSKVLALQCLIELIIPIFSS